MDQRHRTVLIKLDGWPDHPEVLDAQIGHVRDFDEIEAAAGERFAVTVPLVGKDAETVAGLLGGLSGLAEHNPESKEHP